MAQIAEIDENLFRNNLTPSEEALAVESRAELVKALELEAEVVAQFAPPPKKGAKGGGIGGVHGKAPASNRDLSAKTGRSKDAIRRSRNRAKELGTETLEAVKGTSLDKGVELDALVKHPVPSLFAITPQCSQQRP